MLVVNGPLPPRSRAIRIMRPPPRGVLHVEPLVVEHVRIHLHYFETRSVPCLGECCVLCEAHIPAECRVFFLAKEIQSDKPVVVELPRSHHESLEAIGNRCGGLHQSILVFSRPRGRRCSPIHIAYQSNPDAKMPSPMYAHWLDRLEATWHKNVEFAVSTISAKITDAGGAA